MDKIISIWKPVDITSYDVIRKIKNIIKSSKIGHCGTLDPFAEGVLVVCIGQSTKRVDEIMNCEKIYDTTIAFGAETDTLDLTGDVIKSNNKNLELSEDAIHKVISKFVGKYEQVPPYYSAKKICGVKMYKLARKNIFIRRKPTEVNIHEIALNNWSNNHITLRIKCGKGTYIRSLCRDISYSLNTYGYVKDLKRVQVGGYTKENSITLDKINDVIA